MALATQTLLTLMQKLGEATCDFLEFDTTTDITTDNYIISTTLGQYDESEDDHFGGADTEWWVYITEGANSTIHRRTSDYSAASTRITVEGAALSAESAAVTCRLYKYNRDRMKNAIVQACEEIYPALYLPLEDITLVTGNILPDASFESWSSASSSNWWVASSVAIARTSSTTYVWSSPYSAKVTPSAANGYIYLDDVRHKRLLDLQDDTVDMYCMARAETANDATIELATEDSAGSTQTLTSTTTCAADNWTLLKLENQVLNDDLIAFSAKCKGATSTKYTYFDDCILIGRRIYDYLLPDNFRDGHLTNVYLQTKGNLDPPCYDIHPFSTSYPGKEIPFHIISDGTDKYLHFDQTLPTKRKLRLIGYKPLEALSADSETITLDTYRVPLLIAKARMIFWEREAVPISSQDKSRFEIEYAKAERDYRRLLRFSMPMHSRMIGA